MDVLVCAADSSRMRVRSMPRVEAACSAATTYPQSVTEPNDNNPNGYPTR